MIRAKEWAAYITAMIQAAKMAKELGDEDTAREIIKQVATMITPVLAKRELTR